VGNPYVGEIRMFAGNFAPASWAFCNGQLLQIASNPTLFDLIGTTYGGDGVTTFGLPDLQGRLPVHQGTGFVLGQTGGSETVTLTTAQMPGHSHAFTASTDAGGQSNPAGNVPATVVAGSAYAQAGPTAALAAASIGSDGGSQAHDNVQPFLCVSFIISLFGIFPSQS